MNRKAIICGIKGSKLTTEVKNFLKSEKPWGVILFSRNIKNINQLKLLVNKIKFLMNDKKYPILIDQEGGQVSRLNNILDFSTFSQRYFGDLYQKKKNKFFQVYALYVSKVCEILNEVGININTVPVLDVVRKNTNKIIGSRSFSTKAQVVSCLGSICIDMFKKSRIGTVIKHIPGHGLSKIDTHNDISIVKEKKDKLMKKDFEPFKKCPSFFAMTAHIVYFKYDPYNTATHSKIIIEKVIRKHIGFKGLLISDDISMKSLKHGLLENAKRALEAGCNLILHCNGNIGEMRKLAKIVPRIDKFTKEKTSHFYKFLG